MSKTVSIYNPTARSVDGIEFGDFTLKVLDNQCVEVPEELLGEILLSFPYLEVQGVEEYDILEAEEPEETDTISTVPDSVQSFVCDVCEKEFEKPKALRMHNLMAHKV